MVAVLVDCARLAVYGVTAAAWEMAQPGLVLAAVLAAFIGAFLGARLLHKVTLKAVQCIVTALLVVVAAALLLGA